jgi:D-alanyl-lipoteichoic acid acyltransferase DltB (MBOAT superfamily)
MLFNSITFAIFCPLVFLGYWFLFNRRLKWQNMFIVLVSYIFYGWWDWRFLFLMALTTACSYGSGLLIQHSKFKIRTSKNADGKVIKISSKFWLVSNIVLNLAILGLFKYYNFFVENFIAAFASAGILLQPATLHIILPVGISFYTFQALSYSIDVYRKNIMPTKDIIAFFAFVSFFPQLVAGPIERATNLLPQFQQKRVFDYAQAADGMRQILWGLFKKIVVADSCAIYVNHAFNSFEEQSGSSLAIAALFFAFQIYGDFSGYSDIAIGTSRLFGIRLMRNFAFPYFSRDIAEFWRRWHISLTTWFRDYVYIPLGGSRVSKIKIIRNTFIIFLVSGIWHGANWTFMAWGCYHALLFLPLILLNLNRKNTNIIAENKRFPTWKELLLMSITFGLVVLGWILFRAESIGQAFHYISGLCHFDTLKFPLLLINMKIFYFIMLMLIVEWIQRHKQHGLQLDNLKPIVIRWIIYLAFICLIWAFGSKQETFIYFQF